MNRKWIDTDYVLKRAKMKKRTFSEAFAIWENQMLNSSAYFKLKFFEFQ